MENERKSCKPDFPSTISEAEKEKYDAFISVMVQVVEKYGKTVLQELNHVAQRYATITYSFSEAWRCDMNREGKKCVLYPRVSTEMQVEGYSLEGQKHGLKRFAEREEMRQIY